MRRGPCLSEGMIWHQNYDPLGNAWLSTAAASLPAAVLLVGMTLGRLRIHVAALAGVAVALVVAVLVYRMPAQIAFGSAGYGAAFGLFPIGWIIINVMFLYELTVKRGLMEVLRDSVARIAPDARVQLVLIAFSFGAFLEGMAGFGAPVAITGAILLQLGFSPLHASGLALIANTAPVAFGSLGIPITTLEQVAGLDAKLVSMMVGRQLPLFSMVMPLWILVAFCGWSRTREVLPVALVAGAAFGVPQYLVSNFHGPWLVDLVAGAASIIMVVLWLRKWRPRRCLVLRDGVLVEAADAAVRVGSPVPVAVAQSSVWLAWLPWAILTGCILIWGTPSVKGTLDGLFSTGFTIGWLDGLVQRMPPVAAAGAVAEGAKWRFNLLSATGTGILAAALISGLVMGFRPGKLVGVYLQTVWKVRLSLLTIGAMLALGNVTKFSGADATIGLALAGTGTFYPFFGTLLGWLGVALTGSDTASNVLFGSLQRITAEQTGISPVLMGAANSSGGVMGKMVDAQSIVVASTATQCFGREADILRFVLVHSLVLASLIGLLVTLQAYVWPFRLMVPAG
jgi:lactate permease